MEIRCRFQATAVLVLLAMTVHPGIALAQKHEPEVSKRRAPHSERQSQFNRWDIITGGMSIGGFGITSIQLFTRTWKYFRITVLDAALELGAGEQWTLDWHIGSLVGVGYHGNSDAKLSHWFVAGLWYGGKTAIGISNTGSYRGLYVPVGQEFRWRFGKDANRVWGIRLIAAFSPVGQGKRWERCPDNLFSDAPCVPVRNRTQWLMFGLTLFVGT